MIMQVKDTLAGVGAGVDDDAKAAVGDSLLPRQARGDFEDMTDHGAVIGCEIENAGNMPARDDENMDGRLRIDVLEGNHRVILVNDISFDLALDDATEKTIAHRLPSLLLSGSGESDKDALVDDFKRQALQRRAEAGPPDAFAGGRLEDGAVIGAHEIAAIDGEKLVVNPIHREADMGTTVDVGEMAPLVIDHHRLEVAFAASQLELLCLAGRQLAYPADHFTLGRFTNFAHGSTSIFQIRQIPFGAIDQDFAAVDSHRQPVKRFALSMSGDAEPR